jgi:hypothetical protein
LHPSADDGFLFSFPNSIFLGTRWGMLLDAAVLATTEDGLAFIKMNGK